MAFFKMEEWNRIREGVLAAARLAGEAVLDVRQSRVLSTVSKSDGSPVTLADHRGQEVLLRALAKLTPDIPLISEENHPSCQPDLGEIAWIIDPIDATKNFISGGVHFTVNIALICSGLPVIGVIYAPALDDLFYGGPDTCYRLDKGERIDLKKSTGTPPYLLITNSAEKKRLPFDSWEKQAWIRAWGHISGAYKFGMLAAGNFDFYPRTAPSSEWDIAAGDAILRQLGGGIVTADGQPMTYGKKDFLNPPFLAFSTPLQDPVRSGVLSYLTQSPNA